MTEWPYPAPPGLGSNGVGIGAVGVAQVGDIPIFDVLSTVISQYSDSPRLLQLITDFAGYVDQTEGLEALYDLVLNLDSAQGYGLDRWGRVVGVNRVLQVPTQSFFGFAEALPGSLPFGDARFTGYSPTLGFAESSTGTGFGEGSFALAKIFSGVDSSAGGGAFYAGGALTSNYALSDQTYRILILAKAAANITSGSIPAINKILLSLFPGRGNCYVQEGVLPMYFGFQEAGNTSPFGQASLYNGQSIVTMTMTYVFKFQLSPVELAIVGQSGVLPKPVGVAASISVQA